MTDDQEKSLRFRLGLLCMAATAGREGDMKAVTGMIIECVNELIKQGDKSRLSRPKQET